MDDATDPPGEKKGAWEEQEDAKLASLVQTYDKNWVLIAQHIPGRSGKSCRLRYGPWLRRHGLVIIYLLHCSCMSPKVVLQVLLSQLHTTMPTFLQFIARSAVARLGCQAPRVCGTFAGGTINSIPKSTNCPFRNGSKP